MLSLVRHKRSTLTVCSHRVTQGHTASPTRNARISKTNRGAIAPNLRCDRDTPEWWEKHLQDKFADNFTGLFAFTMMKEMFEFPPDISSRQEMPPFCQLIFAQMHDAGGKSTAVARLPRYDLSRLCREPVCGRQLSLKLVTVQPPTCQLNSLFICLRAMHYGREQSLLMALCSSQFLSHTH